jgi:nucleoside-diphosphate-sugar epimerase
MATSVVLGGAGFLGSHLVDSLISDGNKVVVLDDFSSGTIKNLEQVQDHPLFSIQRHDICHQIEIDDEVDMVFNFASPASPPRYLENPIHTLQTGSSGTNNAILFALEKNARLVQASTSEVYGDPLEHPQTESYWGNVNPIGIRSCYDEAKRYGEALCMAYKRSEDLDVAIVRIFNTYGPRLGATDGRVVSNLIVQALDGSPLTIYGDGLQTRSFCFVSDLIDGIRKLASSDACGPINIGNPVEFTVLELAQMVKQITATSSTIEYLDLPADDPMQRCPEIALARSVLNWEPRIGLEDGLRQTIQWFKEQGGLS